jgi:tetratricopeptide (TPR) repeat protein
VGQGELVAAAAYLGACLIYLAARRDVGRGWTILRIPSIALLYALALGAKESAVTLPGALLLLGVLIPPAGAEKTGRGTARPLQLLRARLRDDAPLLVALAAVLGTYLAVRVWVLGSVTGENVPAALLGLGAGARVLTALSLWPTWLRLLLVPLDLSSDYGPAVLLPATSLRADVLLGALILAGLLAVVVRAQRVEPWAALAAGWLVLTVLPVSNLFFPAGTMLAERTLYLPSVAVALAAGGVIALVARVRPARLPVAWVAAIAACGLLLVRTVTRNPTWLDSFTVMRTLAREHPESVTAHRARAAGLVQAGDLADALHEYDAALVLMPNDYAVLTESAALYKRERRLDEAERLLTTAVRVSPDRPIAYRLLSELYLLKGDGRSAHAVALAGLAHWGADHDLWGFVSESYVAKGDLAAAVRAREAALAQDPGRASDRARLAELLEAQSRTPAAESRP